MTPGLDLPAPLAALLDPLFAAWPLARAMPDLVPARSAAPSAAREAVARACGGALAKHPALCAGLWLYVDELDASHTVSQGLHDAAGSLWHALMHRREGDFDNSRYWLHRAGAHPALRGLDGHDPGRFVEAVRRAQGNPPALVAQQRAEWAAAFAWCARRAYPAAE